MRRVRRVPARLSGRGGVDATRSDGIGADAGDERAAPGQCQRAERQRCRRAGVFASGYAFVVADVEGQVKARSSRVYTDTENNTARVRSLLGQRPPDVEAAQQVIATMQADLAPIVQSGGRYSAFDADVLLREGLEALLVVGALLAFGANSGNAYKALIWAGAGAAIAASIAVVLLVKLSLCSASSANRELLGRRDRPGRRRAPAVRQLLAALEVEPGRLAALSRRAWRRGAGAQQRPVAGGARLPGGLLDRRRDGAVLHRHRAVHRDGRSPARHWRGDRLAGGVRGADPGPWHATPAAAVLHVQQRADLLSGVQVCRQRHRWPAGVRLLARPRRSGSSRPATSWACFRHGRRPPRGPSSLAGSRRWCCSARDFEVRASSRRPCWR